MSEYKRHQMPKQVAVWVFDGDCLYCQKHQPHTFYLPCTQITTLNDAVELNHPEIDFAITKQSALILSLPLNGDFQPYRTLITTLKPQMASIMAKAIQLLVWQKTSQFCGACGTKTQRQYHEYVKVCPDCHHHIYPKIQPCIIVAITRKHPLTNQTQILLAQHHRHQTSKMYGLIAGFVEVGETLEEAVHREVLEEVGLTIHQPIYIDSQAWPYPTNLMVGFMASYQAGEIVIEQAELSDAQFFNLDDLPLIPAKPTIANKLIHHIIACHHQTK